VKIYENLRKSVLFVILSIHYYTHLTMKISPFNQEQILEQLIKKNKRILLELKWVNL
jgi:hypothetical protein